MTSQIPPGKLKSFLKDSPNTAADADDEEEKPEGADDDAGGAADDEETDDEGGDEEEVTVESLAADLKPAVAAINEIIDEFRTGSDEQPKKGVETLEETEGLDADKVHAFCKWTEEAGKKDFRALGDQLDLEDVDGFVGWCRAVRKMEEEGTGEGGGEDEKEDENEDEGAEGGDQGSNEETESEDESGE
jgi:hypothetical protein